MTRSFTNTLLFESALDSITSSNPVLFNISENIFRPTLKIVEENCETLLGKETPISFRVEGGVELSTGLNITPARLSTLISAGNKTVNIRTLDTCISLGGVCRQCLEASYPRATIPAVGFRFKLLPEIVLDASQLIIYNGGSTLDLPYSSDVYDDIYVYQNGLLVDESEYTISDRLFTLITPAASDLIFVFKYRIKSNILYYYWIANTYSGSLLGIKSFDKKLLPVKKEVLKNVIPPEDVESLIKELKQSLIGQEDSVQYLDNIKDPLERAIFATLLGAIFLNN